MAFIPFDIEKAKAGVPVVTKDGRSVRIICYDRVHEELPIVALVMHRSDAFEIAHVYRRSGRSGEATGYDLCHPKPEMYVNVYEDGSVSLRTYVSIEAAKDAATEGTVYKLVKVE